MPLSVVVIMITHGKCTLHLLKLVMEGKALDLPNIEKV